MAETTKIEWCDSTANFWIGCTKDGQGCVFCYAEADWDKRKHRVQWGPRGDRSECAAGRALVRKFNRAALRNEANGYVDPDLGRRRRIFVNSLSDSFDDHPSIKWRDDMFYELEISDCLDHLLLTKRVENVQRLAPRDWVHDLGKWPEHIALGISVPTQAEAGIDVPHLVALKRQFRIHRVFLSMEPLLERVFIPDELMREIDWVIVGGESGRGARPMRPDWAREIRDQCARLDVPYLFKQWGEWVPKGESVSGPDMIRVGKRNAGRLLDGVQHDGFPA